MPLFDHKQEAATRLPKFEYGEPRTLREAVRAIASDPKGTVALAGGTDLLVHMKHRLIQPKRVVNLKTIPRLA
jgi:CO/xanthine dehydrogenase FAD-binding subunit